MHRRFGPESGPCRTRFGPVSGPGATALGPPMRGASPPRTRTPRRLCAMVPHGCRTGLQRCTMDLQLCEVVLQRCKMDLQHSETDSECSKTDSECSKTDSEYSKMVSECSKMDSECSKMDSEYSKMDSEYSKMVSECSKMVLALFGTPREPPSRSVRGVLPSRTRTRPALDRRRPQDQRCHGVDPLARPPDQYARSMVAPG